MMIYKVALCSILSIVQLFYTGWYYYAVKGGFSVTEENLVCDHLNRGDRADLPCSVTYCV